MSGITRPRKSLNKSMHVLRNLREAELSDRRQITLKGLSLQPRMTAIQISKLHPYSQNGSLLKTISPKEKPKKIYNPGSYPHTTQMLARMEAEGLVKRFKRVGTNLPEIWALAKTTFARRP